MRIIKIKKHTGDNGFSSLALLFIVVMTGLIGFAVFRVVSVDQNADSPPSASLDNPTDSSMYIPKTYFENDRLSVWLPAGLEISASSGTSGLVYISGFSGDISSKLSIKLSPPDYSRDEPRKCALSETFQRPGNSCLVADVVPIGGIHIPGAKLVFVSKVYEIDVPFADQLVYVTNDDVEVGDTDFNIDYTFENDSTLAVTFGKIRLDDPLEVGDLPDETYFANLQESDGYKEIVSIIESLDFLNKRLL